MKSAHNLTAMASTISEAIDYTLSERSALLKKYFYIYSRFSELSSKNISHSEKESLLSSLDKNEEMIHQTGEKLKNLESLLLKSLTVNKD